MLEVRSDSAEETERVATLVAGRLDPGDVVFLRGEIGTGKTTFVRAACRALGVTAQVTSPTFTIGHRYAGRTDVSHLDLYRFSGMSTEEWGDLEPYFDDAIVFVEWPDACVALLPRPRVEVSIEHLGDHGRLIRVTAPEASVLQGIATW